jgi:hypothetical protein
VFDGVGAEVAEAGDGLGDGALEGVALGLAIRLADALPSDPAAVGTGLRSPSREATMTAINAGATRRARQSLTGKEPLLLGSTA